MAKDKPEKKEPQKPQRDRFKEAARVVEADESDGALERAFSKVNPKRDSKTET